MRASLDEALGVLSKWHTEESRLVVILVTDGAALRVEGWFVALLENGVGMVLSDCANPDAHNLVVAVHLATDFHYGDPRDAPEYLREKMSDEVESMMALAIGKTTVLLYESRAQEA